MSVINLGVQQQILDNVNLVGGNISGFNAEQLRMIDFGTNLYDNNQKRDKDSKINVDGTISAANGNEITDYIPISYVVAPTLRVLVYRSVTKIACNIAFYDCNKEFISLLEVSNDDTIEIPIPQNAHFCRLSCSYHATYGNIYIVNYADRFVGLNGYQYTHPRWVDGESPKGNLIKIEDLNVNVLRAYATGLFSRNVVTGYSTTKFLPVKYGHRYFVNAPLYNDSHDFIWEYDSNYNPINQITTRMPIYTPSSEFVKYVVFQFKNINPDQDLLFMDAEDWDGKWGMPIATKGFITERQVSKGAPISGWYLAGAYNDHKVIQRFSNGPLYYFNGDIRTADMAIIPFNSESFPDLSSGATLAGIYFFECIVNGASEIRSLVLMGKNQIYASTTGPFSDFVESNIWDMKGNKYWLADETDKDPTGERYRMHFPSDLSARQNAFNWHNGPVWMNGVGGQYSRGLIFANYTNAYAPNTALPSCVFYTEDGVNIYVQYMFGIYQKYYKTSDDLETEKQSVTYNFGDLIDWSGVAYSGGLSVKKRWNILPSADVPDPTNIFAYGDDVTITAINGNTITLASGHSMRVGDTIIIQGETTDEMLTKALNNDASETDGGLTAFVVRFVSGNDITLCDTIGFAKNNLMCRHIHGVQEFGEGVVFYTGEEYPESYIMYMNPYQSSINNGVNMNDDRWFNDVVRLNSSKNAYQRSLGVYLRSDKKIVFIADSNSPQTAKLQVRDKDIKMGTYGIHIFDLADIDNATTVTKIQGLNAGYALYYILGVLFFSDYKGKTYYSEDEGDSWKYLCTDGQTKSLHTGFLDYERTHLFGNNKSQIIIENNEKDV